MCQLDLVEDRVVGPFRQAVEFQVADCLLNAKMSLS